MQLGRNSCVICGEDVKLFCLLSAAVKRKGETWQHSQLKQKHEYIWTTEHWMNDPINLIFPNICDLILDAVDTYFYYQRMLTLIGL